MGSTFDWLYTAEMSEILEALDIVGVDSERMMAQKTMSERMVLVVGETENLDDEPAPAAGQVAV